MQPAQNTCPTCGKLFIPVRRSKGLYCSRRCWRSRPETQYDSVNFWRHVDQLGDCWLWTGTPGPKGYGTLSIAGKHYLAHRHVWTLVNGPIPPSMEVCHSCDTPLCVHPDHLFLGTHLDNMRDMLAKGRQRTRPSRPHKEKVAKQGWDWTRGDNHWSKRLPSHTTAGARNSHAKLTPEQVEAIKQRRSESSKAVARDFGVCASTICRIWRGEAWRCLE